MKPDADEILARIHAEATNIQESLSLCSPGSQLEHDSIVAHLIKFRDSELTRGFAQGQPEDIQKRLRRQAGW